MSVIKFVNEKSADFFIKIVISMIAIYMLSLIHTNSIEYTGVYSVICLIVFAISALGTSLMILAVFKEIPLEKIFLLIATTFGILLMILLPLRVAPDETVHIMTAYRVSDYLLRKNNLKDKVFEIRNEDLQMFENPGELEFSGTKEVFANYYEMAISPVKDTSTTEIANDIGLSGNEIAYLFSAIGISAGRMMKFNAFWTLMFGRMCNLFVYLCLVYFSIKLIPNKKQLLLTIAVFPVTLQQVMSYSYDSLILSCSFFVIAMTFYYYFNGIKKIKNYKMILFLTILCSFFLIFVKSHAYFMIGLFPAVALLKQKGYLTGKTLKNISKIIIYIILLYFITCFLDKCIGLHNYIFADTNEEIFSVFWIVNHPYKVMTLLVNTVMKLSGFYYITMINGPLGWLNLPIPTKILLVYSIVLLLCFFVRDRDVKIDCTLRLFMIIIFIVTFLGIEIGLMLTWTKMEYSTVTGVQGRYFIPICFFLISAFTINKKSLSYKVDYYANIIIFCSLLMMVNTLLNRF